MFVIAEYGKKNAWMWRGVIVDPATGRVTFYRCHRPNRFWSWGVEDEYECALSELQGGYWMRGWKLGVFNLEIVTPTGRAMLPNTAKGFDAVCAAIRAGLPPSARLRWYQYPPGQTLILLPIIFGATWSGAFLLAGAADRAGIPLLVLMLLCVVILLATRLRGRPMW